MLITVLFAAIVFNSGTGSSEKTQYELSCESEALYIRCWDGAKIKIVTVFWGRKKDDPHCGGVSEKVCLGQPSATQDFLMKSCDKQMLCLVNVTAANLGNPCPEPSNSINYLQVAYQCLETPKEKKPIQKKRKQACKRLPKDVDVITENSAHLDINCELDQSIKFKFATYGKIIKGCSKRRAIKNTGSRKKTMKAVYKRCEGRMRCSVPIRPRLFGDRHSRGKRLQVGYKCVDRPLKAVDVKENDEAHLKCRGQKKVFINLAYDNCIALVEEECQGHNECYVSNCRLKYSCQTLKKFGKHDKSDEGSGSTEESGEDSSEESSENTSEESSENTSEESSENTSENSSENTSKES